MAKARNSKKASKTPVVFPEVGSIYTFKSDTGFYGAIRIAKIIPADPEKQKKKRSWSGDSVGYVTTPYYEPSPPELTNPRLREIYAKNFGIYKGEPPSPGAYNNWQAELPFGDDFTFLGVIAPVAGDDSLGFGFGYLRAYRIGETLEHQRAHDNGYTAPPTRADKLRAAAKLATAGPTLADVSYLRSLLKLSLFAKWKNHSRSKKFIAPARAIVRAKVEQLQALGDAPEPAAVKETLKDFIEQFNRLHECDPFVETSEGDDLTEVFSSMARIMKLPEDPVLLFEKWERF